MVAIFRHARKVARRLPPPPSDHFNGPLYSLKAFAIATAIVASGATASVAGVMAYLDVRNVSHPQHPHPPLTDAQTTEFAARMRTVVPRTMPLLTAKIYRHDAESTPRHAPTTFDHDAAEQRLANAFDDGGFDAWAEAAASELEAEADVERARKRTMS